MDIKNKIIALIPKTKKEGKMDIKKEMSLVQEIKVPDLKQYLINGYEEIRQVKKVNEELEEKLEEQKKNEILYNSTLVTLEEFKKRDDENKQEIEKLKQRVKAKEDEIYILNDKLNTYRIQEEKILNKGKGIIEDYKNLLKNKIEGLKGNLSKKNILELIKNT